MDTSDIKEYRSFESIKKTDANGNSYWEARELSIVQNGDPRKEIIALGQTYFAIQTRRQEVQDYFHQLDEDNKRLVVRGDIKQWNQMLMETARQAGIIDSIEYADFQNAGYSGLYGGETVADIHKRKKLKEKEKILDFMNSSELVANL